MSHLRTNSRRFRIRHARRGVIAVLAAFFMIVMVALCAFSIDIGMMANVRTDLQRSADAAALAGAMELTDRLENVTPVARQYARLNVNSTRTLTDADIQVQTGHWDEIARVFSPGAAPLDAVRVDTRVNDNPFFFAHALGHTSYSQRASAVAVFQPRDIMLVLDYSGSMQGEKIANLKESVRLFCGLVQTSGRGQDRVGFVRYSTTATLERPLTFDVASVNTAASNGSANGFTNIGDGLSAAINELQNNGRPRAKKLVLLLTDGLANRPLTQDPVEYVRSEARRAASGNIPVVSVSFGFDADRTLMQYAASTTGTAYFHVQGTFAQQQAALNDVFRRVAVNRPLRLVD